jgi:DNA-binding NarL/FixJ family response regulator
METNTATKSVYVVEDSVPVRARLVEQLYQIDGVSIVGQAASASEAVAGILETQPDYVVLDFQLEDGTGVDVLRAARPQMPATVFIVLTNHPQAQFRRICLEAGADAFFDKSTEFGKVRQVIVGAMPTI